MLMILMLIFHSFYVDDDDNGDDGDDDPHSANSAKNQGAKASPCFSSSGLKHSMILSGFPTLVVTLFEEM